MNANSTHLSRQDSDVINAGVSGQTLLGDKVSIDLWLKYIESLNPEIVIVYCGHNDALYSLDKADGSILIDPEDSKARGLKEKILINSALVMLVRELKGNVASWALNKNLFDCVNRALPVQGKIFKMGQSDQRIAESTYAQKFNGLIESIHQAWPNSKIIFVAQSNPNCYFYDHYSYRSYGRNLLCEDLLVIHRHTRNTIMSTKSDLSKKLFYEPFFYG